MLAGVPRGVCAGGANAEPVGAQPAGGGGRHQGGSIHPEPDKEAYMWETTADLRRAAEDVFVGVKAGRLEVETAKVLTGALRLAVKTAALELDACRLRREAPTTELQPICLAVAEATKGEG